MLERELDGNTLGSGIESELKRVYEKHQKEDYSTYFKNSLFSVKEIRKINHSLIKKAQHKKDMAKEDFSFKEQFKTLCKQVPQLFVRQKLDEYKSMDKEKKQLWHDMDNIENNFSFKQWLTMSALLVGFFWFQIFSEHMPLGVKIFLIITSVLGSFSFCGLFTLLSHEGLTHLFSGEYKRKNKELEVITEEQEKLKRAILKGFKKPENQLQLMSDLQHYREHIDTILGAGFADNFKELIQIEKGVTKVFAANKNLSTSEQLWTHLWTFYKLNREIKPAQKNLKKKMKAIAKEESLKRAMAERLSEHNDMTQTSDLSQLL